MMTALNKYEVETPLLVLVHSDEIYSPHVLTQRVVLKI